MQVTIYSTKDIINRYLEIFLNYFAKVDTIKNLALIYVHTYIGYCF